MTMTSYGARSHRSPKSDFGTDTSADNVILHRLHEAIVQDNPTAIICMKTATKDYSEEQWNRVFNQLDSRHQAYVQQKTQQHNDELHELEEIVKRNLASERRLLDEQLANHRSSITAIADANLGDRLVDSVHSFGGVAYPTDLALADEVNRLRAALAAKERELASAEDRQARSRRLCDALLSRLAAAESELQFLRNRRTDRRASVGIGDYGGAIVDNSDDAGVTGAPVAAVESVRRSLVNLERHQLIDTADALELSGDPSELERRYDCLQVERREIEAALSHVPRAGSVHHTWHSVPDQEMLEKKLDNIDRELVHLRNSLKQFQLI